MAAAVVRLALGAYTVTVNPETREVVLQTADLNLHIPPTLVSQLAVLLLDVSPLAMT